MSHKGEEDSELEPKKLVFLLAYAGRIDAQNRILALTLAQNLHETRYIYHLFAILDSLSSSYSMFKYFFEVFISTNDPDLMHDVVTSPEGIALITGEALFLVAFSLLASIFEKHNKYKDKKKNGDEDRDFFKKRTVLFKEFVATYWPYFRAMMKGLKNAYKGWRSAMQLTGLLLHMDLRYLIIPCGLVLGILSAANRMWLRNVDDRRDLQMRQNKTLLTTIEQSLSLSKYDYQHLLEQIKSQDKTECAAAFAAVCVGGVIDGLYLYVGVASLAILSFPAFLAVSVISFIYILSNAIVRICEEYDKQLALTITQTKCELALVSKSIELAYGHLIDLQNMEDKQSVHLAEIEKLKQKLKSLFPELDTLHRRLNKQTSRSYLTVGLLGMRFGLTAYGVLTSFLFMISTVFLVTATVFPPIALVICAAAGLGFMIALTVYTLRSHYIQAQAQQKNNPIEDSYSKLMGIGKQIIEDEHTDTLPKKDVFKQLLTTGTSLNSPPKSTFLSGCAIFRSIGAGLSKGFNFFNFAATPLQDTDFQGHYHDTPIMRELAIASAVLFSFILGLREFTKEFGKSKEKKADSPPATTAAPDGAKLPIGAMNTETPEESNLPLTGAMNTEAPGESSLPLKPITPDSPPPLPKKYSNSLRKGYMQAAGFFRLERPSRTESCSNLTLIK